MKYTRGRMILMAPPPMARPHVVRVRQLPVAAVREPHAGVLRLGGRARRGSKGRRWPKAHLPGLRLAFPLEAT
jgi:hypothetical protein